MREKKKGRRKLNYFRLRFFIKLKVRSKGEFKKRILKRMIRLLFFFLNRAQKFPNQNFNNTDEYRFEWFDGGSYATITLPSNIPKRRETQSLPIGEICVENSE